METRSLESALDKLYEQGVIMFDKSVQMLPNFVLAILVFFLILILSKRIARNGRKALDAVSSNKILNEFFMRIFRFLVVAAGLFVALGIMHLDKTVTSLLAGVGLVGLALSFAFQHTAANILSGVIISIQKSVDEGDLVRTNGHFGNVQKVGIRATKILNMTGQMVEIPNRLIMDNPIEEYSATGYRRIDVTGQMNLKEDLTGLKKKIEAEMGKFDFVHNSKPPNMVYNKIEFEKVDYTLRVWMDFTSKDGEYVNARSACIERLSEILRTENIEIPMNQVINIHQGAIPVTSE